MNRVLATCAILFIVPLSLAAQSHPLAGTWDVTVPAGMRVENGESTPIIAKGVLNVSVTGDSLIGMLEVEPPEGLPARPASRLAARAGTGPTVFVAHGKGTINMNGVKSERPVTSTYTLEAAGDSLKGNVGRVIEGMENEMSGPQPISGKRVKSTG